MSTDLQTIKTGMLSYLTKGVEWDLMEALPAAETDQKPWIDGKHSASDLRLKDPKLKTKSSYVDSTFTDYDVTAAVKSKFVKADGKPIASFGDVPTKSLKGRFYGLSAADADKTFTSFKDGLQTMRKDAFTKALTLKKKGNTATWNSLQKGVNAKTQSQLDTMTKTYKTKSKELQAELDEVFRKQKEQFLINKQHNLHGAATTFGAEPRSMMPTLPPRPGTARQDINLGEYNRHGKEVISTLKTIPSRSRLLELLGPFGKPKPVAAQHVAAKPVATQHVAAKPVATQPVATQHVATQPVVAKPVVAKPVATQAVKANHVNNATHKEFQAELAQLTKGGKRHVRAPKRKTKKSKKSKASRSTRKHVK